MTTESTAPSRVFRTEGGTNHGAIGLGIYPRLTGAETKGTYSLFEYVVPPGLGGPPTHIHSREDELFTCVEGRVTVELDGVEHVLAPGDSPLMPRGVPHVFYNSFDVQTRVIAVVSPPGLENYYRELSELAPGRDMKLVAEVMTRYGLALR